MKLWPLTIVLFALGYAGAAGTVKNVEVLSVSHLGDQIFVYLKDFNIGDANQCVCAGHSWDTDSQLTGSPTYYVRWAQSDSRSNQFLSIALTAFSTGKKIKASFGNSQFIDNLFMMP